MGLDITVTFDNWEELHKLEGFAILEEETKLSRTFCNLMCRRSVVEDTTPELDQLGDLTSIDIEFLYNMEEYSEEWEIDEMLEFEEDEVERKRQKEEMLKRNSEVENNLKFVTDQLTKLIKRLEEIPNLVEKLEKTENDTLGIEHYFSDFTANPGDGYLNNNLGQDLRNLLKLATFGKQNASKTIYFNYG